jgi:hypothetical protein
VAPAYRCCCSRDRLRAEGELGRRFAALAFRPAARVHGALTGSPAWRESSLRLAELGPGPLVLDLGVGPGAVSLALWRVMSGLHHRFSAGELGALLASAGFRDVTIGTTLAGCGPQALAIR